MSPVDEETTMGGRYSRRRFLARLGLGAGAVVLGGSGAGVFARPIEAAAARSRFAATRPQTFGRMFAKLDPFAPASPGVIRSLQELGAPGGPLDAGDRLDVGPVQLILDPALSADNRDNPTHTAGTTFMGQFIDHDLTFDTTSKLAVAADPALTPNARTAALDLDSVYGGGPSASAASMTPPTIRRSS